MSLRASLSRDGLFVAKSGGDVGSALERDLLFSPNSLILRVRESGAVGEGVLDPPSTVGALSAQRYWRNTITFAETYDDPPIVYVCLSYLEGSTMSVMRDIYAYFFSGVISGVPHAALVPRLHITVSTTELHIANTFGGSPYSVNYHYFVMEAQIP